MSRQVQTSFIYTVHFKGEMNGCKELQTKPDFLGSFTVNLTQFPAEQDKQKMLPNIYTDTM